MLVLRSQSPREISADSSSVCVSVSLPSSVRPERRIQSDQLRHRHSMAADRCGSPPLDHGTDADQAPEFDPEFDELYGGNAPKRHARVTVKYNRKELQRRLDVEKWIDECLDQLYSGQESDMPEEVNIDELIEMPNDEERVKKLQEVFQKCPKKTESFIRELVEKLEGMHKQEELQTVGIEHPVISHGHYRHEPYHFNQPHHQGPNKTL